MILINAQRRFLVRRERANQLRLAWRLRGWERLPRREEIAVYSEPHASVRKRHKVEPS